MERTEVMLENNKKTNSKIFEIKEKIQKPKDKKLLFLNEERLYIFLSLDICNSTQLKTKIKDWIKVNNVLYRENISSMHFWKYNGDEVLYMESFSNLDTLVEIIKDSYRHIKSIQTEIKNSHKVDVQIKGTIWIARVVDGDAAKKEKGNNLHISIDQRHEFLGINIDEGFRLTGKVSGSKIVVDPKIIYLLLLACGSGEQKEQEIFDGEFEYEEKASHLSHKSIGKIRRMLENTYFTGYTKLKGVWENRNYPIFWYYEEDTDFEYDEQLDNCLINNTEKVLEQGGLTNIDLKKKLAKIFCNVNIKNEIQEILKCSMYNSSNTQYSLESYAKLYYAVACVFPKSKKILIAKRGDERNHLKGVWEFLVFKHTTIDIVPVIEKYCKDEFNIEIKLITDNEEEKNIIPIHFCTIYRNGKAHNSMLCLAEIVCDDIEDENSILEKMKEKKNEEKYIDFRFVDMNEAKKYKSITLKQISEDSYDAISGSAKVFEEDSAAMYFAKSVQAVRNYYNKIRNGGSWYTEERLDG